MSWHVLLFIVWGVLFLCTIPVLYRLDDNVGSIILFEIIVLDASGLMADIIRTLLGLPI